jgi:hypothetical protein
MTGFDEQIDWRASERNRLTGKKMTRQKTIMKLFKKIMKLLCDSNTELQSLH